LEEQRKPLVVATHPTQLFHYIQGLRNTSVVELLAKISFAYSGNAMIANYFNYIVAKYTGKEDV